MNTSQSVTTENSILPLLEDVERVVHYFDPALRGAALHVYYSALVFMPECRLYHQSGDDIPSSIQLISERSGDWPPLRRVLEGHTHRVTSIAFSPDGTRIASSSKCFLVHLPHSELAQFHPRLMLILSLNLTFFISRLYVFLVLRISSNHLPLNDAAHTVNTVCYILI
jgi:WD40 repeat protein